MRYYSLIIVMILAVLSCQKDDELPANESVRYSYKPAGLNDVFVNIHYLDSIDQPFPLGVSPLDMTGKINSGMAKHTIAEQVIRQAEYISPNDTIFTLYLIIDGKKTSVSSLDSTIRHIHAIVDSSYSRFSLFSISVLIFESK